MAPIQDLDFTFDVLGNLTGKTDVRRSLTETYDYDGLNRLTDVSGSSSLTMTYDGLGNITSKSDVGSYLYAGPRPHAVTTAGSVGYLYDGNGNLTSGDGRSNSYTVFNKPYLMSQAGNSVSIDYGPNRERYRRIEIKGGNTTSTHYVGAFEKIWRPNGINETKRYLDGEVIVTTRSNGTQDTEYLFTDHLGSTDVITDNAGSIVQSMGFDAFGKRRDPVNYAAYSQTTIFNFDTTHTTKGFTGHEGLDPVGLIHMNGRVYEPTLGRFLSADSIVQDPSSTQSLNRYTYVFNNPLSYTDPSGYEVTVGAIIWRVVVASIIEYGRQKAVDLIKTAGANPTTGAVPSVFGNGAPSSSTGGVDSNSIRDAFERCVARHECMAADGAGHDPTAARSAAGTGTEQTGGNFENGAATPTYSLVQDIALSVVPGGDVFRCSFLQHCDAADWTLAVVGVLPTPAKLFVIAGKVAVAATIAVKIERNERRIREALEADKALEAARGGTYKLRDPATGQVRRTGQSNDLERRRNEHARGAETKDLDFEVDKRTDNLGARRGREQIIHDQHPEADLNRRNPISPTNPRRDEYLDAGRGL